MTNPATPRNLPAPFVFDAEFGARLDLSKLTEPLSLLLTLGKAFWSDVHSFIVTDNDYTAAGHYFHLFEGTWYCLAMHGAARDPGMEAAVERFNAESEFVRKNFKMPTFA